MVFHVNMTQGRKGYASGIELNAVRTEYLSRAHGLPLAVYFNTRLFRGNVHEMSGLVRFFWLRELRIGGAALSLYAFEKRIRMLGDARVTDIMSFFPEDFLAEAPSLIAWINRRAGLSIPEQYRVEFIPYDWTVAAQP